jgi:hypothetical protein
VPGPAGGGRIRPELRTVLADSGYVSEGNIARVVTDKLRLLAPLAKTPAGRAGARARQLGMSRPTRNGRPGHRG